MNNSIKILDWDSDFFGFKIGSISFEKLDYENLKTTLNDAKTQDFRLIYGFQDNKFGFSDAMIAQLNGKLLDKKVVFSLKINSKKIVQNQIEEYRESNPTQELYDLAIVSGNHSRFLLDPIFGRDKFEKLYRIWIEKSVNHSIADKVFVYTENKQILGMITLKINQNIANIGLLSVNPNQQGKGIGKRLIDKCVEYCQSKQVEILKVPTQLENHQACHFYKKYGFEIETITHVFHFYL